MAIATLKRDRKMVNHGDSVPYFSSSFLPPRTPAKMTMAILVAMPEYLMKSFGDLLALGGFLLGSVWLLFTNRFFDVFNNSSAHFTFSTEYSAWLNG